MKKLILLIGLALFYLIPSKAQNFISEDVQWNVRLLAFGSVPSTEIFRIQGDSAHNFHEYKKIWVSYDSTISWVYQGLVREEANIVYYVPPNFSEGILYDFNLEIGDTAYIKNVFCVDTEVEVIIQDIDTVTYFGVQRKRWLVDDMMQEYWIEGIGSQFGPLYSLYYKCIICPQWDLLCYFKNDLLFYIMPGQTKCFVTTVGVETENSYDDIIITPNPVIRGEAITIKTAANIHALRIFDSSGHISFIMTDVKSETIINTTQFKSGVYLLKLETANKKVVTEKIIIL